jgi:hypothetical protein
LAQAKFYKICKIAHHGIRLSESVLEITCAERDAKPKPTTKCRIKMVAHDVLREKYFTESINTSK